MNPQEFVCITKDAMDAFEKLYEGNSDKGEKEALQSAYLAASSSLMGRLTKWLDDSLYANPEEEVDIPEGQALDYYIRGALYRLARNCAKEMLSEPIQETIEKYNDLFMKQIYVILSAYSGKEIKNPDDDGIYGEESDCRHLVFDNTLAAISCVKEGKLNKQALANTFRALADFYEKDW